MALDFEFTAGATGTNPVMDPFTSDHNITTEGRAEAENLSIQQDDDTEACKRYSTGILYFII